MERITATNAPQPMLEEHQHRYFWANLFANGQLLDMACGTGYGSMILSNNSKVESYTGVDISESAIDFARANYASSKSQFKLLNACDTRLDGNSFDTVVSLETIEHVPSAADLILEIRRLLKPDGVLIGSIPTIEMEERCEELFGTNPYHIGRFDFEMAKQLIEPHFEKTLWHIASQRVSTSISLLGEQDESLKNFSPSLDKYGSYIFIAGPKEKIEKLSETSFLFEGQSQIECNHFTVKQFQSHIDNADTLVEERNQYILELEERNAKLQRTANEALYRKALRGLRKLILSN